MVGKTLIQEGIEPVLVCGSLPRDSTSKDTIFLVTKRGGVFINHVVHRCLSFVVAHDKM